MADYKIRITRQAKGHLQEIRRYIEKELFAPDAALGTVRAIRAGIAELRQMPERIKPIEEQPWGSNGIRKIRVKNYYAYFWIDEGNRIVQVIGVIYVKRDQAKQLEQMQIE